MRRLVYRKARRLRQEPVVRHRLHVTKGDMVQVVAGEHKGKRARVLRVDLKKGRVTLEGVNLVKRHRRATTAGGGAGVIEFPAPIHHSHVMLLAPQTGAPTPNRPPPAKD